jgi:hypothetical protein
MYYSQPDLAAIKTASSTPGGWQVESTNAGTQTFPGLGTNSPANANYPNATIQFSATNVPLCAVDTEYQHDWVVGPFQSVSTAVFFAGNFFVNGPAVGGQSLYVCHRKGIPGSPAPLQDALIPPTPQQAANYLTGLPTSDPKSVEAHTNPVGTTGTRSQRTIPSRSLWLRVKCRPRSNRSLCLPEISLSSTTSATSQHPAAEYAAANDDHHHNDHTESRRLDDAAGRNPSDHVLYGRVHENRTFGTVLQAHQTMWASSGLLSTLNLLKSLTWPSTLPVIALALGLLRQSASGLQSVGLVLHRAPHARDRHCLLRRLSHHLRGRRTDHMTAILTLIYCWLQEFFFSLTDWGLGHLGFICSPWRTAP